MSARHNNYNTLRCSYGAGQHLHLQSVIGRATSVGTIRHEWNQLENADVQMYGASVFRYDVGIMRIISSFDVALLSAMSKAAITPKIRNTRYNT